MRIQVKNNELIPVSKLPKSFRGVNKIYSGDFDLQSNAVLISEGFYPVEYEQIDTRIEKYGDWEIDYTRKVATRKVVKLQLDLAEQKELKHKELIEMRRQVQTTADLYTGRLKFEGESIPSEFQTKAQDLYSYFDSVKAAIDAFTDVEALVKYELPHRVARLAIKDIESKL